MIDIIETEKHDPKTPRLSFAQVQACVKALPDEAVMELATGPIEGQGRRVCGVCEAIVPHVKTSKAARLLKDWHDDLGFSEEFSNNLRKHVPDPTYELMCDEINHLIGSLMYARCAAIYGLAMIEVRFRLKAMVRADPDTEEEFRFGQEAESLFGLSWEELAPGVKGYAMEVEGATYFPAIQAVQEGNGDVGRWLDSLPNDKTFVIPAVMNPRLEGMLRRRGWQETTERFEMADEEVQVFRREATF